MDDHDFDFLVIGSGFGGSVSAMRLSQKGYRVGVIEAGKWWKNDDFAKINWNLRRYEWQTSRATPRHLRRRRAGPARLW